MNTKMIQELGKRMDSQNKKLQVFFFFIKNTISLVRFSHSVVSNSLQPHGLQHARFPCPSLSPRVCSSSFLLNLWCHLTMCMCILTKLKIKKKSSSPKGCLPFKSPRRKPAGSPPGTPAAGRSSPGKIAPFVFLSTLELSLPSWEHLTFLFQNQRPWVLKKNSEKHWFSTIKQQGVGSRYVQYRFENCRMDFFTSPREAKTRANNWCRIK